MDEIQTAEAFLRALGSGTKRQREKLLRQAPWLAVQTAALRHPAPETRFWLLFVLDHHHNDGSTTTFAEALRDPDARNRGMALHSIACEPCKEGSLCVADVVPSLVATLLDDPSARLRSTAVRELLRFAGNDQRVVPALEQAAARDPDAVVRGCASEALAGRYPRPRKPYERSQRRHAQAQPRR